MNNSSTDYTGREWPAELYSKVSESLLDEGIRTDRVPEQAHKEALESVFEYLGTPKRLTDKQRETFRVEDVGRFVDGYREALEELDLVWNGRNPHERGVDALMQRCADGSELEDYDILIKNTFYSDPDYTPWTDKSEYEDIELTGWRTLQDRLGSDADFIGVDLDNRQIDFYEVKETNLDLNEGIREKKLRRAERQKDTATKAINSHNTEFDADSTHVLTHNLTHYEIPMPDLFDGDIHVVSDLSDKSEAIEEFSQLFDNVAFDTSWNSLENVNREAPDTAI